MLAKGWFPKIACHSGFLMRAFILKNVWCLFSGSTVTDMSTTTSSSLKFWDRLNKVSYDNNVNNQNWSFSFFLLDWSRTLMSEEALQAKLVLRSMSKCCKPQDQLTVSTLATELNTQCRVNHIMNHLLMFLLMLRGFRSPPSHDVSPDPDLTLWHQRNVTGCICWRSEAH